MLHKKLKLWDPRCYEERLICQWSVHCYNSNQVDNLDSTGTYLDSDHWERLFSVQPFSDQSIGDQHLHEDDRSKCITNWGYLPTAEETCQVQKFHATACRSSFEDHFSRPMEVREYKEEGWTQRAKTPTILMAMNIKLSRFNPRASHLNIFNWSTAYGALVYC